MNENTDPYVYKMCIDYFKSNKKGLAIDLARYFISKYNFTAKKHKYGENILQYVHKDVSSALKRFEPGKEYASMRNFTREWTKDGYLYTSTPLTTNYVLPKQTEMDFGADIYVEEKVVKTDVETEEKTEEVTVHTTGKNSPLFEDVKAAEHINNQNLFQPLIEQMNIHNLEELNCTYTLNNKKIQVTITNA